MNSTSALSNATILIRCNRENHINCIAMRNKLVEKFPNIASAWTTSTTIAGDTYCVAARAIVKTNNAKSFEKKLSVLKNSGTPRAKKIAVLISN